MNEQIKKLTKGSTCKKTIATFCLICIFLFNILHARYMDNRFLEMTKKYFFELSRQTVTNFQKEIENDFLELDMLATKIGGQGMLPKEEMREFLWQESQNLEFVTLGTVSPEGYLTYINKEMMGENQPDRTINISDRKYLAQAFSGQTVISDKLFSRIDNRIVHIYATPIYQNGEIIGALMAYRGEDFYTKLMNAYTLEGNGLSYVLNSSGNIVFQSEEDPEFFNQYYNLKREIKHWFIKNKTLINNAEGTLLCEDSFNKELSKGSGYYIAHTKLPVNNWVFVSYMARSEGELNNSSYHYGGLHSAFYLMVMLLALAAYMIFLRNQDVRTLENVIEEQAIHDTSYRIIMEQTMEIIFEYNPKDKSYFYTANFKKTFGYEPTKKGILDGLQNDYIHPEDVLRYVEMYNEMKETRSLAETEVRIITADGDYIWTRIQMTGVFDLNGQILRVIGKIVDINETRQKMDSLAKQAVLDSATGLYNKQTTKEQIEVFLEGEGARGKHALLIIDIDDFKDVNDEYGHRQGDLILSELANRFNHLFRTTDIKGRVGGDEFMILIKDVEDHGFIAKKAERICNNSGLEDNEESMKVTNCIGIAFYDQDGEGYDELYEAADKALYACKNSGKGKYAFYDKELHNTSYRYKQDIED